MTARAYRRPLFPLVGHGITGPIRPDFRPRTVREWLAHLWCLVVGCDHPHAEFRSWCLYACQRCGCEMLGRGWDDIEPRPIDADDWEDYR